MAPLPEEVVDLTLDDDDDHDHETRKRAKNNDSKSNAIIKKVKTEPSVKLCLLAGSGNNDNNDDDVDEVVVVAAPVPQTFASVASNGTESLAEEEIEIVGTKNSLSLPHMRMHCVIAPFNANVARFCDECYCYVCDIPASECTSWNVHCRATDSGPQAYAWKRLRQEAKKKTPSQVATAASFTHSAQLQQHRPVAALFTNGELPSDYHYPQDCLERLMCRNLQCDKCFCFVCSIPAAHCSAWYNPHFPTVISGNHNRASTEGSNASKWNRMREHRLQCATLRVTPRLQGDGPWPPTDVDAQNESGLTKCRHCQFYSRLSPPTTDYTSCGDWCGACGRVAGEKYLRQTQGVSFDQKNNYTPLGTKTFDFRLHAHDPRKMKEFENLWKDQEGKPGWIYNSEEMEQELFEHRFGERPRLEMLLGSAPVVSKDKIPVDGNRIRKPWMHSLGSHTEATAVETEAILLDPQALATLKLIHIISPQFGNPSTPESDDPEDIFNYCQRKLDGDISATWDKSARKGTLTIRVHVRDSSYVRCAPASLACFLGCWFDASPFPLVDLCGSLTPTSCMLDAIDDNSSMTQESRSIHMAIESLKNATDQTSLSLALTSSAASQLGGTCQKGTDFKSLLKRYINETFAEIIKGVHNMDFVDCWLEHQRGVTSRHKPVDKRMSTEWAHKGQLRTSDNIAILHACLSPEDFVLALSLKDSAKQILRQVDSLHSLMQHLENRGHPEASHVDGLTVELLPFQKQSVQWALERELTPGGVQSFWITKLPSLGQGEKSNLYYDFLLGKINTQKPNLVRGGFLSEMMGLGKTVISLALILQNPAPQIPASGSCVSAIPAQPGTKGSFWDPKLNDRTRDPSKKRGGILSRGTLVVCSVSLVGQWIEEAKSKLQNPGLVYSYYGNRTRDPIVLAQNSIVVTTYETLSSDSNYHKKKSDSEDYCPPCEQVRWWRIICDESHVLRSNSGKSKAVLNLVADHKWLVSGTPISTTLLDLENQFRFLDLQNVPELIAGIRSSTCETIKDKGYRNNGSNLAPIGHFTFLMRALLMRHSHDQMYTSTNTTLMSLPPKSERVVSVALSGSDKNEYDHLESTTLSFYKAFKDKYAHEVQRHYFLLLARLKPLRIACAGGQVPVDVSLNQEDDEDMSSSNVGKPQNFSDHVFTSKSKRLIEELQRIQTKDPSAKSLVFSQFTSTLNYLKRELLRCGFQYRTLQGDMTMNQRRKALLDFQNDPPTTIFLLSMRAGACGINLTQANHVFLMEPCLNPALEAQAIGRVHRLGQTRPVEIVRLIVENSIETRLQAALRKKFTSSLPAREEGNCNIISKSARGDVAMLGSITSDKSAVAAEEFDLLFGFDNKSAVKEEVAESASI